MLKKLIAVALLSFIFINNVNASTLKVEEIKDNELYKEYEVTKEENINFYENLEEKLIINEKEYVKDRFEVTGGNVEETIDISDIKEIITKTNSLEEILNYLPRELEYNKDGYVGKTKLNIDNIQVQELYNGYYEEYVEETKQYFDLPKNDMDYIPKEITKDGITLYLINVDWYTQTTKNTGDIEITDLYRGEAHYKGVIKINNPSTYRIIAGYNGTATKIIEKSYIYKVIYKEVIQQNVENKQDIVVPVLVSTTSCIFVAIVLIFFNQDKAKIYKIQYGKFVFLKNLRIDKSKMNLNKLKDSSNSSIYKIILNKKAYKKYKNTDITIIKNNKQKKYYIEKDTFEVNI